MEERMVATAGRAQESVLATNKVIRNTYILLSLTLLFSALMAGVAMVTNAPYLGPWITLGGYFALLFLTAKCRNSAMGLVCVFALTGFMGFTLGPIINAFMASETGSMIVMQALGGTAVIFLALSGYALTTRKDFSFMGGFLLTGILVAFIAALAGLFLDIPALHLAVSAAFLLLASGLILFETSNIIHGGETNYIMATVTLYVSIYNIFVSLLHLLSSFSGD